MIICGFVCEQDVRAAPNQESSRSHVHLPLVQTVCCPGTTGNGAISSQEEPDAAERRRLILCVAEMVWILADLGEVMKLASAVVFLFLISLFSLPVLWRRKESYVSTYEFIEIWVWIRQEADGSPLPPLSLYSGHFWCERSIRVRERDPNGAAAVEIKYLCNIYYLGFGECRFPSWSVYVKAIISKKWWWWVWYLQTNVTFIWLWIRSRTWSRLCISVITLYINREIESTHIHHR